MTAAPTPRPRLRRRTGVLFWCSACALAFALAFGLGMVWTDKRADQEVWTTAMGEP